jgi:hypothetical protein
VFDALSAESLDVILSWENDQWVIPGQDQQITPLVAYYIKAREPIHITLLPSSQISPLPSRALHGGISLIGPAPPCSEGNFFPMPLDQALISVREAPGGLTGYTMVISPGLNQPGWSHAAGGTAHDLLPFRGYWVVMENPDTLYGFSTTPVVSE